MPASALREVSSMLVPVDGTEAAYRALHLACETAKRTRASLHILYVIEVPRSVALDAPIEAELSSAEQALERAEQIADEHGIAATGDLVQARQAGHAIVDEAVERSVDAIIIGVTYQRPYGRFELGRVAQYVLEHAPEQVWLIRAPEPAAR